MKKLRWTYIVNHSVYENNQIALISVFVWYKLYTFIYSMSHNTHCIENTNQLKIDYILKLWYITYTCTLAEYWLVLWLNSNCCLWLLRCHADINSYTNHQFYLWLLLQCYLRIQNKGCDPIETLNDKQTWFHVVNSKIE